MPSNMFSTLGLAAAMGLAVGAAEAAERVESGEIAYRARIALPEDARVIVEARARDGRLLAEYRAPTGGRRLLLLAGCRTHARCRRASPEAPPGCSGAIRTHRSGSASPRGFAARR